MYYSEEDNFQDLMLDAYDTTITKQGSLADLITASNDDIFDTIRHLIHTSKALSLTFGIENGLPYYEVDIPESISKKLYLNKEIIQFILKWLKDGEKNSKVSNVLDVHKNANANYGLYLLNNDRKNGVSKFNSTTGEYKAVYPNGTINYGKLPYTPEELVEKLNSLR